MKLIYKMSSARSEDVYAHLSECSDSFEPPLREQLDLQLYASKIADRSITFEGWDGEHLVGLVAAYLNEQPPVNGFITSVSTITRYLGKGIAKTLLEHCIVVAVEKGFSQVGLEVRASNFRAIKLYEKCGFESIASSDDKITMVCRLK